MSDTRIPRPYDAAVEDVCGHGEVAGDDEQPGDPAHYWHDDCTAANPEHCRREHHQDQP